MNLGLSIIVCCYNSSVRLPQTLAHLARQQLPGGVPWEVVLVDNASTDDTAKVATEIWSRLGQPAVLKVIREAEPGLAQARRAGVLAAAFAYIVFCDDDNWLAPDYLQHAFHLLQTRPEIGVIGGRASPVWEPDAPMPDWFFSYAGGYALGVQALRSSEIPPTGSLWGAGMVVRAHVLRCIYQRGLGSLLSGRNGSSLVGGDDTEICRWLVIAGYRMWYDEKLRFSHFIPQGRQTLAYVERLHSGFRASARILLAYAAWIERREARKTWWQNPLSALRTEARYWKRLTATGSERQPILQLITVASEAAQ